MLAVTNMPLRMASFSLSLSVSLNMRVKDEVLLNSLVILRYGSVSEYYIGCGISGGQKSTNCVINVCSPLIVFNSLLKCIDVIKAVHFTTVFMVM